MVLFNGIFDGISAYALIWGNKKKERSNRLTNTNYIVEFRSIESSDRNDFKFKNLQ